MDMTRLDYRVTALQDIWLNSMRELSEEKVQIIYTSFSILTTRAGRSVCWFQNVFRDTSS